MAIIATKLFQSAKNPQERYVHFQTDDGKPHQFTLSEAQFEAFRQSGLNPTQTDSPMLYREGAYNPEAVMQLANTFFNPFSQQQGNLADITPKNEQALGFINKANTFLSANPSATTSYKSPQQLLNEQLTAGTARVVPFGGGNKIEYKQSDGSFGASHVAQALIPSPNKGEGTQAYVRRLSDMGFEVSTFEGRIPNISRMEDPSGLSFGMGELRPNITSEQLARLQTVTKNTSGGISSPTPVAPTTSIPTTQTGQNITTSGQLPTTQLQRGSTGNEVKKLQDYLVSQGLMMQSDLTGGYGIYGPLTEKAVAALQARLGVDTSGGGVGRFGPMTIQKVQGGTTQSGGGSSGGQTDGNIGGDIGTGYNQPTPTNPASTDPIIDTQTTGVPQLDALLQGYKDIIANLLAKGQTIPKSIVIDDATAARFTAETSSQLDAYYQPMYKALKDDYSKFAQNAQKQYELSNQATAAKFQEALGSTRESAAGAGLAFSGGRARQERGLQDLYQRNQDAQALQLEGQLGGQLRGLEQKIGSKNITDLMGNTAYSTNVDLMGIGGFNQGRQLSFAPTGNQMGSLERERVKEQAIGEQNLKDVELRKRNLQFV